MVYQWYFHWVDDECIICIERWVFIDTFTAIIVNFSVADRVTKIYCLKRGTTQLTVSRESFHCLMAPRQKRLAEGMMEESCSTHGNLSRFSSDPPLLIKFYFIQHIQISTQTADSCSICLALLHSKSPAFQQSRL